MQAELARDRARVSAKDAAAYDDYADQIDATVVRGVNEAFRPIFLISAALALVAALVLAPRLRPGVALAGAAAVALPAVAAAVAVAVAPTTPAIEDPCQARPPPAGSGIIERVAMDVLDRAACRRGISREKLIVDSAGQLQRELGRSGTDPQQLLAALDRLLR